MAEVLVGVGGGGGGGGPESRPTSQDSRTESPVSAYIKSRVEMQKQKSERPKQQRPDASYLSTYPFAYICT
jgi:hypothetical protein